MTDENWVDVWEESEEDVDESEDSQDSQDSKDSNWSEGTEEGVSQLHPRLRTWRMLPREQEDHETEV